MMLNVKYLGMGREMVSHCEWKKNLGLESSCELGMSLRLGLSYELNAMRA